VPYAASAMGRRSEPWDADQSVELASASARPVALFTTAVTVCGPPGNDHACQQGQLTDRVCVCAYVCVCVWRAPDEGDAFTASSSTYGDGCCHSSPAPGLSCRTAAGQQSQIPLQCHLTGSGPWPHSSEASSQGRRMQPVRGPRCIGRGRRGWGYVVN
jgi:hypothetical protein